MKNYLKPEDIEFLISPPLNGLDPEVIQYVQNMKIRNQLFHIQHINKYLNELYQVYPNGNPTLFFVAHEMSSNDIDKLFENLKNPDFIVKLQGEAQMLGICS